MTRPLFEQYKEALRRGHVALLGGEFEAALAAYREAAELVPDRPLPHASIGLVLQRLGRGEEALEALDRALAIAPDDEAALQSRAALLEEVRQAVGTAGPGLEVTAEAPVSEPEPEPEPEIAIEPAAGPQPESGAGASALTAPPGVSWPAIDLPSPPPPPLVGPPPDPAILQAEADACIDAGDPKSARDPLLQAMAVHRDAGRLDAALDACLQLLVITPGDPRVHLAIANLQLDRGWHALATEKIELLLRLTSLSGDARAEADVHLLAADRLRDESPQRLEAKKRGSPAPS